MLLPDKPPKGADQKLEGGGGGMGDFRKNILKTDFGGKFLQGNTRPGEKNSYTEKRIFHGFKQLIKAYPFYVGKKIILTQTNSPITYTPFKGEMGDT